MGVSIKTYQQSYILNIEIGLPQQSIGLYVQMFIFRLPIKCPQQSDFLLIEIGRFASTSNLIAKNSPT